MMCAQTSSAICTYRRDVPLQIAFHCPATPLMATRFMQGRLPFQKLVGSDVERLVQPSRKTHLIIPSSIFIRACSILSLFLFTDFRFFSCEFTPHQLALSRWYHKYNFFAPSLPSLRPAFLFSKRTNPAYSITATTPMHVTPMQIEYPRW